MSVTLAAWRDHFAFGRVQRRQKRPGPVASVTDIAMRIHSLKEKAHNAAHESKTGVLGSGRHRVRPHSCHLGSAAVCRKNERTIGRMAPVRDFHCPATSPDFPSLQGIPAGTENTE